jgi:hypothetical protein
MTIKRLKYLVIADDNLMYNKKLSVQVVKAKIPQTTPPFDAIILI